MPIPTPTEASHPVRSVAPPRVTRIELHRTPDGLRSVLRTGLLAPRVTRRRADGLAITLVATEATLLGGDHLEVQVVVGPRTHLDLRDVAATVAYDGRGVGARWTTRIEVGAGASLSWWGEPLVLCDGSSVERRTHARVADGGRLLLREAITLGRHGEQGGDLDCETRLVLDDRPAVVEQLRLDRTTRALPGHLPGHLPGQSIDTVTLIGERPAEPSGGFLLAAPGAMRRVLNGAEAEQREIYDRWFGDPPFS